MRSNWRYHSNSIHINHVLPKNQNPHTFPCPYTMKLSLLFFEATTKLSKLSYDFVLVMLVAYMNVWFYSDFRGETLILSAR